MAVAVGARDTSSHVVGKHRRLLDCMLALLVGVAAAALASVLGGASNKVVLVGLAGVAVLPALLWFRSPDLMATAGFAAENVATFATTTR